MSTEPSKADIAVEHVLRAIQADGRKAYLLGRGTQCFALLTEARAEALGVDVETFRDSFWQDCHPERVRVAE